MSVYTNVKYINFGILIEGPVKNLIRSVFKITNAGLTKTSHLNQVYF